MLGAVAVQPGRRYRAISPSASNSRPQRAAIDELVQFGAQRHHAARRHRHCVADPPVSGDVGGDQPNPGSAFNLQSGRDLDLGHGGPALPVARGESTEVGVGVDGRTGVDLDGQPTASRLTCGDGVKLVADGVGRPYEDTALQHQTCPAPGVRLAVCWSAAGDAVSGATDSVTTTR